MSALYLPDVCYEVYMHYLIVSTIKVRELRVYRVMNLLKITQLLNPENLTTES